MLHAYVRTFDVTGTVENFFGTKQGLRYLQLNDNAYMPFTAFVSSPEKPEPYPGLTVM